MTNHPTARRRPAKLPGPLGLFSTRDAAPGRGSARPSTAQACGVSLMPTPPLTLPTTAEFAALGREFGLTLDAATLGSIERTTRGVFTALQRLDELSPTLTPVKYLRDGGRRPLRNPLNAWSWQGTISGAGNGVLQGKTVVVKDINSRRSLCLQWCRRHPRRG